MNSNDFVMWLNGFFELSEDKKLNEKQVQVIKDHLALVFNKVTPDRSKLNLESNGTTAPSSFEFSDYNKLPKANQPICAVGEVLEHRKDPFYKGPQRYC